jgi:hypothetical protein
MGKLTDEEREGLSDEELEALEEDTGDDMADIGDHDDDDGDGREASAAGEDDAASGDADADDEGEEGEDEPQQREFMPVYDAKPVEGYDAKMAEYASQKKGLREQLNNGDITLDEYEEKKDAIVAEEQALRESNLKAQISSEQRNQTAMQRWEWEQEKFFGEEGNGIYKDRYVLQAFDLAVRDLANDEKNAQRSPAWFLQEADRIVRERFNIVAKKEDAPIQPKGEKPKRGREPDLSKIPKTLANLPNAELAETGGDEFAYLEKLDGIELERALRKLTPEQEARYLGISA